MSRAENQQELEAQLDLSSQWERYIPEGGATVAQVAPSSVWLGSARSQVRTPTCGKQFRHHVHSTPPGDAKTGQVYGKAMRSVV